jgi:hypothetical protein
VGEVVMERTRRAQAPLACEAAPAQSVSPDALGNADRIALLQEEGHLQSVGSLACEQEDTLGAGAFLAGLEGKQADPAEDVSGLSFGEKTWRTLRYTHRSVGAATIREVAALLTPSALAAMSAFLALYVAAQLTPAGWIANGIALASMTVAGIFTGVAVYQIVADLVRFGSFPWARTEAELEASGQALATAMARVGVGLAVALLTAGLGRLARGAKMDGPPPPGMADAVTPAGQVVRMPVAAAQEVAVAQPSALVQGALYAVALPPGSGGGGGGSGGGAGKGPTGPEIWEQLSEELRWAEDEGGKGPGAAVRDASEAGLQPDLALQQHRHASKVRKEKGVTGKEVESAHVGPTSMLETTPGYSQQGALTTLLDKATHGAFDAHWKKWAYAQRDAKRTEVSVKDMREVMLKAIQQTPDVSQRVRNVLAWRLELELRELNLSDTDMVRVPFSKE